MTRASVVVSILLAACASQARQTGVAEVPRATHDSLRALPAPCIVGDTTSPSRDTVYALGIRGQLWRGPLAAHCVQHRTGARRPIVIHVELPAGADYRDAFDGSLPAGTARPDVVVTSDADVLAYAARNPAFLIDTLPWGWLYGLASRATDSAWTIPTAGERADLARDAIRGTARGAVEPFDWLTLPLCSTQAPWSAQTLPVVGYFAGDDVGRQLAERVVALAAMPSRPAWIPPAVTRTARVSSITPTQAADSVVSRYAALVLPFRRSDFSDCGFRGLAPLVDMRYFVIVRRGSGVAYMVGTAGALWFVRRDAP